MQRNACSAVARSAPPALIVAWMTASIKQRAQLLLLGGVGLGDRRRDLDAEPARAQQLDSGARPVEAARAAMRVMQPGARGVQGDLHRHRPRVQPVERAAPRTAPQQHRVGQDRDGGTLTGDARERTELRVQERLAAGQQHLASAESGELLAGPPRDVDIQPSRPRAWPGLRAAVVTGQVAVEVRVQPQPRSQRR